MAYRASCLLLAGAGALLAATLPACGDSSTTGSPGGAAGPKLSEVPARLAAALCKTTSACAGPLWDVYLRGQDCVTTQTESITQGDFSLAQGEIDAGRATYDASKVEPCAAAIEAAGCDLLASRLSTICDGLLVGTGAAGSDCTVSYDCQKGLYCKSDAACPGSCTALQGVGKACKKSDDCADGLTCSDAAGTCIQPVAKDGACGGTTGAECAFGLFCAGATATTTGACKAVDAVFSGTEGAACSVTDGVYCESGLSCALTGVDANNTAQWKCEKPSTSGACHIGYPETCPDGQYCELGGQTVDGTCKALPGDGQACAGHVPSDPKDKKDLCAVGATCAGAVCKTIQRLGGACGSDAECLGKLCSGGKCVAAQCAG